MSEGPKLIYLGTFPEGLPTHVILPTEPIRRIEARLAAEQARRQAEAAKAKLQVMQAARGRTKLTRALTLVFGLKRGRRGR
jgi:hypothetical protein